MPAAALRPPDWTEDEIILVCDVVASRGWRRILETEAEAQELSDLLRQLPIHPPEQRSPTFRSANSVSRKSVDLRTLRSEYLSTGRRQTNGSKLDKVIAAKFANEPELMHQAATAIRAGVAAGTFTWKMIETDFDDELNAPEGRLLARQHMVRERDRRLRDSKIASVRAETGRLACEICGFDFEERYGERGEGYIECHHIVPLHAAGHSTTRLGDLIVICANCHRMIHRRSPWLTPDELRVLIGE
ncbi:HNH endonuclease [Pseudofrankia sp. BMG5.36]|uniref:HNH endonuclease n=1 Tax=Pseudofrankia sp. BMG5.36 TaxID=1834512 RepID=UPI0008DB05D5|nr:HNH endonuclease [Pseudofrankia sp. BMG5.36]OHV66824.1 hypothetical protein BCD48_35650 [Pseudofrankia sp. BMG5.36]